MGDISYISAMEFRDVGYLQEINRLFLHPLGLALEADLETDSFRIWDCRDEPEGLHYGDLVLDPDKSARVTRIMHERMRARRAALGYVVQPYPRVRPSL